MWASLEEFDDSCSSSCCIQGNDGARIAKGRLVLVAAHHEGAMYADLCDVIRRDETRAEGAKERVPLAIRFPSYCMSCSDNDEFQHKESAHGALVLHHATCSVHYQALQ